MNKALSLIFLIAASCHAQILQQILSPAPSAAAISPTLVQAVDDTDWSFLMVGGAIGAGGTAISYLPSNTKAGNTLVVALILDDSGGATTLPTVTDGSSDTFSSGVRCYDSTNGESIVTYTAPGIAGGTNKITTTYHATNNYGNLPIVSEWAGLAASSVVDKSTCNYNASGTAISAGASGTLGHSGDLILQFAWNDTLAFSGATSNPGNGVHYTAGSAGSLTWKLLNNSSDWAFGSEYAVYGSTSTITPSFTISTAKAVSAAIYLIPCTSCGTLSATQAILYRKDQPTATFASTTPTFYAALPAAANTLAVNWAGGHVDLSSLTDSHSNSYSSPTAYHCDTNSPTPLTCVHNHYDVGATVSENMTVTPTFSATAGNDFVMIYALKGMTGFDTQVSASADQTGTGNITYLSITPGVSTGIVIFSGSLQNNTHSSFTSPTGALTETCYQSNEAISYGGCAANNPWGNLIYASTAAQTWTGSFTSGSTSVGWWTAEADSYK